MVRSVFENRATTRLTQGDAQQSQKTPKRDKVHTSSSKPSAPRLLPIPPDADVAIGTADCSGTILSLILSKNDMVGDSEG